MFAKTKKLCDSFLEMGVPGFDLAVYKDGKCVFRYMGGYSDLEYEIPMKGNERYNIYSCSKPITCVAAMQLWEKGLFSLDNKLSDYMPEFSEMSVKTESGIKKAEKPILIKHLFEMTAGFSYNTGSQSIKEVQAATDGRCPTREVMKYLAREPLCFEPGECWNYSLCHDVLAALVEVLSGMCFSEYVKKNIFDPLGMNNSTFLLPESELDTLACQYRFDVETKKAVNCGKNIQRHKLGTEYASGGAGCISTVDDYMKFLEALRIGDIILNKETIKFMATDRLSETQRQTYWAQKTHGYGLGLRTPKAGGICTDFGWSGAAGAYLAVDVENGMSIYHAQHMLSSPNSKIRSWVYRYVMAELLGKEEFEKLIRESVLLNEYKFTF